MFDFYRNFKPLSYSVLLHVLILGVFTVSLSSDPVVRPMPAVPEIIQAEALDEAQVLQEVERLKENENKQRAAEKSRKRALEKKTAYRREKTEVTQKRAA
ncbi:MAG: cell envelope integrity protein TolA [Methylococcaceae bacterium]|nr:cell envelope integrity protein TolA [Methylococcaceae bacterium]